jgi:hypothetical protein
LITEPATRCLPNVVADADADADGLKTLKIDSDSDSVCVSVSSTVAGIMTKPIDCRWYDRVVCG